MKFRPEYVLNAVWRVMSVLHPRPPLYYVLGFKVTLNCLTNVVHSILIFVLTFQIFVDLISHNL